MARSRKAFHFDLDVNNLKSFYPSDKKNGWKRAWSDIRVFMERNGFEHAQYSGYESVKPMTYDEASEIIKSLSETFPWFRSCAQAASLTVLGKRHDVLQYLAQTVAIEDPEPVHQERDDSVTLRGEAENMRRAAQALSEDSSLEPPTMTRQDESR